MKRYHAPDFETEIKEALGSGEVCTCPECGKVIEHQLGVPCTEVECPECGSEMRGEQCKEAKDLPKGQLERIVKKLKFKGLKVEKEDRKAYFPGTFEVEIYEGHGDMLELVIEIKSTGEDISHDLFELFDKKFGKFLEKSISGAKSVEKDVSKNWLTYSFMF